MNVFNRISLKVLVKKHYETFYDDAFYKLNQKKRVPKGDKVIFIFIPLFLSIILVTCKIYLSEDSINIILTCLSIFTGLLFGLLSLVFELTKNIKEKVANIKTGTIPGDLLKTRLSKEELKYKISKELFVNIGFAILLSITAILTSLFTIFRPFVLINLVSKLNYFYIIKATYNVGTNMISYYTIILFILTILMILKRFYLLFESETTD